MNTNSRSNHSILRILLCFFIFSVSAPLSIGQVSTDLGIWIDHLPYSRGGDIAENNGVVYAATQQGLIIFDVQDKVMRRLSVINGLSDVDLTSLAWSNRHNVLMIGYSNGNLDVLRGEKVTNYPDLQLSDNFSGLKSINDIHIQGDTAFLATDFGIVTFDIRERLFRETYLIGQDGSILSVKQTHTDNQNLYAATEEGLLYAPLESAKFFFQNWQRDFGMAREIDKVTVFDEKVFVNRTRSDFADSIWYRSDTGRWEHFAPATITQNNDLRTSKGNLIVCNNFEARAYDKDFQFTKNFNGTNLEDSTFAPRSALIGSNPENFWVTCNNNGLFQIFQVFPFVVQPNSPESGNAFSMEASAGNLFVAPGGVSTPGAPLFNNEGFFAYIDREWQHFPNNLFGNARDVVDIVVDPLDPQHIFASVYGTGIVEGRIKGKSFEYIRTIDPNTDNGALDPTGNGKDLRVYDMESDAEGNIWLSITLSSTPLGVIRPDGTVEGFSLGSAANDASLENILVTSGQQVWLQRRNNGLVVVDVSNPSALQIKVLGVNEGNGNLPSESVLSLAEDRDGEIWIGTNEGLAVLFSPQNIFEPERSFDATILVIDADGDGNGDRVLGSQALTDITVDGANKKWIASSGSGVFYLSEDGRRQLQRFTESNSPLPSSRINKVEVAPESGLVYFASDKGLAAFQGSATEGVENMTDVFAFPNPVRPDYQGPILIRGLVTNAQVKITDVEGNLVYETVAEGGQAIWDGRNFDNRKVASGVYLAYITDDLGRNTDVAKILIIR